MRTEVVSRLVLSWQVSSVCLRSGIAKPSVWLRRTSAKLPQLNNFRSDYPLHLSLFCARYFYVPEGSYVDLLFIGCCSIEFTGRPLIRAAVGPPWASNLAGGPSSVSSLELIAPRECPRASRRVSATDRFGSCLYGVTFNTVGFFVRLLSAIGHRNHAMLSFVLWNGQLGVRPNYIAVRQPCVLCFDC
jgi:hypothetical protein